MQQTNHQKNPHLCVLICAAAIKQKTTEFRQLTDEASQSSNDQFYLEKANSAVKVKIIQTSKGLDCGAVF